MRTIAFRPLSFVPQLLVAGLLLIPLFGGLTFALAAALGWVWPSNGANLWNAPELPGALAVTLISGLGSTLLSLLSVAAFLALTWPRRWFLRLIPQPLLAVPHAALAIGLAFLVAPTGLLSRWASPWLTGWDQAPNYLAPGDGNGLWLLFGLWIKESAFLLFVALSALRQFPAERAYAQALVLGHSATHAFWRVVWPQLWSFLRLPSLAVLAYGLSTVDMARLLGPSTPPSLAQLADVWFRTPGRETEAAQAALLLSFLLLACLLLGQGFIKVWGRIQAWRLRGRGGLPVLISQGLGLLTLLTWLSGWLSLFALLLWSFAGTWRRFSHDLPSQWTLNHWHKTWVGSSRVIGDTLALGLASTGLAMLLALIVLELANTQKNRSIALPPLLIYAPLLVPQLSFLLGFAVILAWMGINGSVWALVWAHFLFVFPYVTLTLVAPMQRLNPGLLNQARALGAGPLTLFIRVKLPLLLRPLLAAFAIGLAVSLAQYLATLYASALQVDTLATEAVRRASGRSRGLAASFAFAQTLIPLLGFLISLILPALITARRRDW